MACGQQTVKMTISITRLPNEKYGAISSSFDSIFLPNKIFVKRSLLRLHNLKKSVLRSIIMIFKVHNLSKYEDKDR